MPARAPREENMWNSLFSDIQDPQNRAGRGNNNNNNRRINNRDEEVIVTDEDPGINMPVVETETIEWTPSMLPEDLVESEIRDKEDEEEGVRERHYVCELCRIGTMAEKSRGEVSEMLNKIYEEERNSYKHVPDNTRYETMARTYNDTIYSRNKKLGTRGQFILRWTKTMVRHHMEVCEVSQADRSIDNDITLCNLIIKNIRAHGLSKTKYVNGVPKTSEIDRSNFDKIVKTMLTKATLLKVKDSLVGGGTTGPGRRKLIIASPKQNATNEFAKTSARVDF